MSMRTPLALICVGFLVAACGATSTQSAPGDKLYQAISHGHSQYVSVIDSRSHLAVRRLPLGVPTGDWKHMYSLVDTSILDTNPETGVILGMLQLGHAYRLPDATVSGLPGGASPDRRWLVVERYDAPGNDLPSSSHFLLINTSPLHVVGRVDLAGFFDFDAISNDGKRLYLVQLINGKEYFVRLYDVALGRLDPSPVVDKTDATEAMSGIRLSSVASRDGHWLFSLYVREHANPFIHALNLEAPFALCLDLRGKGYADDDAAMQWSLAMSAQGGTIYAANLGSGDVAVVSLANDSPQVTRTAHVALTASTGGLIKTVDAKEVGADSAVVGDGGRTLVVAGSAGVVWIDTGTLAMRNRALESWRIWSLGLSPDEKSLYAVSDGGTIAELSMASGAVGERFDLGAGQPMALMRVAAT
jgi:hypothetical protein